MEREELVALAAERLGVSQLRALQDGGQKYVRAGRRDGADVVLKVIAVAPPDGTQVLERARREVGLLGAIDDPGLVALRSSIEALGPDSERPDGVAWLEELLDGHDLRELLVGVPWTCAAVMDLLTGLARALHLLHQRDVVHRDLSPGNVRRRGSGIWTLMDPGYAKHLARASITGVFQPGTPGFCSPEHAPGGSPAPFSDVYCAGVLGYIASTGCWPIDPGSDPQDYFTRLCSTDVTPTQTLRPDLPVDLARVIDTCLQRQPARRYLDAAELLVDLAVVPA